MYYIFKSYDWLEVRDGKASNSRLIGKYCGESIPPSSMTTGNNLFIRFRNDGHSDIRTGFKMLYFRRK